MIYFLQAGERGAVKIGFARTRLGVKRRIRSFQTHTVEQLYLRAVVPGDREDEALLHRRFAAARVRGEWFTPVPELVECFEDPACFVPQIIDHQWNWERWRDDGLIEMDGTLTWPGREYFARLEWMLADRGILR